MDARDLREAPVSAAADSSVLGLHVQKETLRRVRQTESERERERERWVNTDMHVHR